MQKVIYTLLLGLYLITTHSLGQTDVFSDHLSVISSANPESNAVQSFIIIDKGKLLTQGIKHASQQSIISQQSPFVIRYTQPIDKDAVLQWSIKVLDKQHGSINIISKINGKGRMLNSGYSWVSEKLHANIKNRQQLIFRPQPFKHQPSVYKKGKGPHGDRRKYGGGTQKIDEKKYNPKFSYDVILSVFKSGKEISQHKAHLSMDRIDMIRQEYINHSDIRRYGRGKNGLLPIPKRSEISAIPKRSKDLSGNPLTESEYKLIINDGMLDLAKKINNAYTNHLNNLMFTQSMLDLNQKKLTITNNKLWVSSGWRNPERNEWYSNAVNGIHQRGGAVDLIIMAPANSTQSAIGYWILWTALEAEKGNINAFWQLESNGRPMTTKDFKQDIEPQNGIPDAFDKADHLHANVNY